MIATRADLDTIPAWHHAFAGERKDWRYYEVVNDTLPGFEYGYLVVGGAVQPFFVVDQDLTAGAGRALQAGAGTCRRLWPRLLKARTLMIGCAAGEGHLAADPGELAAALPGLARECGAALVVLKEFPSRYRPALAGIGGFTRVPSMPMTRLAIGYDSFEDFVARRLGKATRKDVRRKLRAAGTAHPPIELQVVEDATPFVDEIYPLYLAVFERATLRFEQLTREFLCSVGRRMPDTVRFFIWRRGGRAIAFSLCMVKGDTIYDEYLGLDYRVAFDLHLYIRTLRDIIDWAIGRGLRWYVSSALNYEPKLHLKSELAPLDLYVAHTSSTINAALKRALPWLEPTRHDPVLRRFPNFAELRG